MRGLRIVGAVAFLLLATDQVFLGLPSYPPGSPYWFCSVSFTISCLVAAFYVLWPLFRSS